MPSDREIKSKIENILSSIPEIDERKVNVCVEEGMAELTGTVDSYWKKKMAENLVSDEEGVVKIANKLFVAPLEIFRDKDISEDIAVALEKNPHVDRNCIGIKVRNGIVTLSGKVDSVNAFFAAYNSALYRAGIKGLINKLKLG